MLLSEFSSHSDLHMAEGMALEDAEQIENDVETTILSRRQPTYTDTNSPTEVCPSNSKDSLPLSVQSSSAGSRSKNPSHGHARGVREWANVLLSPTTPTPRARTARARHRDARRLGVGLNNTVKKAGHHRLTKAHRKQTWDPTLSKIRCLRGYGNS